MTDSSRYQSSEVDTCPHYPLRSLTANDTPTRAPFALLEQHNGSTPRRPARINNSAQTNSQVDSSTPIQNKHPLRILRISTNSRTKIHQNFTSHYGGNSLTSSQKVSEESQQEARLPKSCCSPKSKFAHNSSNHAPPCANTSAPHTIKLARQVHPNQHNPRLLSTRD